MPEIRLPELFTDADGRARWREYAIPLNHGTAISRLSLLSPASGMQWRQSPVGFSSDFHCTTEAQWLIVLRGIMEIGLRDGSWRRFGPGQCFYSNDTLPENTPFDSDAHGHCSRQIGNEPLQTIFVRGPIFMSD